jgi:branched-chain amino acid aminotransferase
VHQGREHPVSNGEVGPVTQRLRAALVAIQNGEAPDSYGWTTRV